MFATQAPELVNAMSAGQMYWKSFLRAIGLRHSFRRTGASSLPNLAVAAALGVISGQYIFKQPLEEFWSEENRAVREEQLKISSQKAGETNAPAEIGRASCRERVLMPV